MPLPVPNDSESESDFVSRTVEHLTKKGEGKDASQRAAIAHDVWRRHKRKHADLFGILQFNDSKVIVHDLRVSPDGVVVESLSGAQLLVPHMEFVTGNARMRFSEARPQTFEKPTKLFEIQPDGDNLFRINNVPVFQAYSHPKRPPVDEKFLDDMVLSFWSMRDACSSEFGDDYCWLPKVHIGHTDDRDMTERPVGAFVDNLRRIGNTLYCDIRFVERDLLDTLRKGAFPDRSIELDYDNRRLISVALLGATPPFFKLPQMRQFSDSKDASKLSGAVARFSQDVTVEHRVVTMRYHDMDPTKRAQGLIAFMEAFGATFAGAFDDLVKFVDELDGDIKGLYEMIRKALLKKKTVEQNTESGRNYEVTLEDLQKFVCSDGKTTAVATNTEGWFHPENPKHGEHVGVTNDGEPASAPQHFDDAQARTLYAENQTLRTTIKKFGDALSNINKELEVEREARRNQEKLANLEKFRSELVALRMQGSSAVPSPEAVDQHLEILSSLSDDAARQKYMDIQKAAPKALRRERVPMSQTTQFSASGSQSNGVKKYLDDYKADPKLRADLRQMGIEEGEHYALVSRFTDIDDNSGSDLIDG